MDLYCEERHWLANACVQALGPVGAVILGFAIRESLNFRAEDGMELLPPTAFVFSISLIIAYVWGSFSKRVHVTSEEIVSTTKRGNWRRKSSFHVPIASIAEVSMVEHGATMLRGDHGGPVVHQEPGDGRGLRLVLNDGSSQFIAFEYPAKAMAAIQEAMAMASKK